MRDKYTHKLKKLEVIHAETAQEFQDKFNARMREIYDRDGNYMHSDPQVEYVHEMGFCAYLTYDVLEELRPKTVKDEFHLEGVYFHCRNCPHLRISDDRRVKYGTCKYSPTTRRHRDEESCELFYKWIANNEVEPVELEAEYYAGEGGEMETRYVRRREEDER